MAALSIGLSPKIPAVIDGPPRRHRQTRPRVPSPDGRQAKRTVLVVDDEVLVRTLLRTVLDREGFAVSAATNGREAVSLYRKLGAEIDLVLLDVRMPGLDGPRTLASLQQMDPGVACCFMTGHSGEYTEADLLRRGAARVFAKPFGLGELGSLLWQLNQQVKQAGA